MSQLKFRRMSLAYEMSARGGEQVGHFVMGTQNAVIRRSQDAKSGSELPGLAGYKQLRMDNLQMRVSLAGNGPPDVLP
jgi:hypothetical protein